ncbi:C40 family peptidase [Mobilicoccus caccae]|uniref:NlpC/P60 domain-containing protein n=1 Tax=Mobilicoccus caccae TaxID=1859295 RepID=A0ABQ6IWG8_9MICO|nr:C40 family peptidase [Mobilicoccus caccae]GMA42295.1 hypothetical protein GCM10025883_43400 [Mobilicoccus caccae]
MKRLLVAATAAVVAMPVIASTAPAAHAAPAQVTSTASVASLAGVNAAPAASSIAAYRAAAINQANRYSRQATKVSWRQKGRNATHLGKLTQQARLHHTKRAVFISRTQLGTRYRWGGTTPAGFDCSGYTKYVYGKAGKNLPRTAAQQFRATKRTSNPAPGDLVFFGGARAHHVGIYLGNGRMIHSPRSGKSVEVAKVWRGASYGKVR